MTSITQNGRETILSLIRSVNERNKTQNIYDHFTHYDFSDQYKERQTRIKETYPYISTCCDRLQELKDIYTRKYHAEEIEFYRDLLHKQATIWESVCKNIKRANLGDELTRSHFHILTFEMEGHLGRIGEYVRHLYPEERDLYRDFLNEVRHYKRLTLSEGFCVNVLQTGLHALEWGLERFDKWVASRRADGITDTHPEKVVLDTMFKQIDKHVFIYKDGDVPADTLNRPPPGNLKTLCGWWLYGDCGGTRPPCPVGESSGFMSDEAVRDFIQFEAPKTPEEYIETFPRYARCYVKSNSPDDEEA